MPGKHADGGGLYLQVSDASARWVFRYSINKRRREAGLGAAHHTTLAEARRKASAMRTELSRGFDPLEVKSAEASINVANAHDVPSFGEALTRHVHDHGPAWRNVKHRQQWFNSVTQHAATLLEMKVDTIGVRDIESVLHPIWLTKPETANRVRQRIERVLGAAIARGDREGPNPAVLRDNLDLLLPPQKAVRVVRHHAAVPVDDAPAAFAVLWKKRDSGIGYRALLTVILTALRSGEVRSLEWADVRAPTSTIPVWHLGIPAERMKAKRDHEIPIPWTLALWLGAQPRLVGGNLLHPGQGGRPMSDMTLAMAMRRSGLEAYTPHGWRSTFRDWAARQGWQDRLAELQLAHQFGSATERAYARDQLVVQRKPMMESWAKFVTQDIWSRS